MIIKCNHLLCSQPFLPSPLPEWASLPPEFTHTMGFLPFSEEKSRMSTSMIVSSPEPCKRSRSPGLSAKPSRRLTCRWMGLSLRDNWLSIRDRDNRVRVSGKGVNHYLSVRLSQLLCCCLHPPLVPLCSSPVHGSSGLFYSLLFCLVSVSLMVFTIQLALSCSLPQPAAEWSLVFSSPNRAKGIPQPAADFCHAALDLFKGQTWLVTLSDWVIVRPKWTRCTEVLLRYSRQLEQQDTGHP